MEELENAAVERLHALIVRARQNPTADSLDRIREYMFSEADAFLEASNELQTLTDNHISGSSTPVTVVPTDHNQSNPSHPVTDIPDLPRPSEDMAFTAKFHGMPRQDPEDYLEDVEVGARTVTDVIEKEKVMKSLFRSGLRGEAEKWYRKQSKDNKEWEKLRENFVKRFPLRRTDQDRGLGAQVNAFGRRSGETLVEYVKRATELADQCDESLEKELRNRFISHMTDGGHHEDVQLQLRIVDRLDGKNLLTEDGMYKNEVSFDVLRNALIAATVVPGRDDNPFFVQNDDDGIVPELSTEKVLAEAMQTMRIMQEQLTRYTPPQGVTPSFQSPYQRSQAAAMADHRGSSVNNTVKQNQAQTLRRSASGNWKPVDGMQNPCWNCGEVTNPSHAYRDCPHPKQPWDKTTKIKDLAIAGKPIPDELRYKPVNGTGKTAMMCEPSFNPYFELQNQAVGRGGHGGSSAMVVDVTNEDPDGKWETQPGGWANVSDNGEWEHRPGGWEATVGRYAAYASDEIPVMAADRRGRRARPTPYDRPRTRVDNEDDDGAGPSVTLTDPPPRNGSPHPATQEARSPTLPSMSQAERDRFKEGLAKFRTAIQTQYGDPAGKKDDTVPIRAFAGRPEKRFNLSDTMKEIYPRISLEQLLDRSPVLRRQMARLCGLDSARRGRSDKKKGSKKRAQSMHTSSVALMAVRDRAQPETMKSQLGYIQADTHNTHIRRCLVDDGSLVELITRDTAERMGVAMRTAKPPLTLTMADGSQTILPHYVLFPLIVGKIASLVRAYVTADCPSYDLLLSRNWLLRHAAVNNYAKNTLTLTGVGGHSVTIRVEARVKPLPLNVLPACTDGGQNRQSQETDRRRASVSSETEDGDDSGSDSDDEGSDEDDEDLQLNVDDWKCLRELNELLDYAEYAQQSNRGDHPN